MKKVNLVGMNKESRDYRRLVCEIAFSFGKRLEQAVGKKRYDAIVKENSKRGLDTCCASHDHCDANEIMDAAMNVHGVFQPDASDFDMEVWSDVFHEQDEAHTQLWNAAWSHWKHNAISMFIDPGFIVK